MRGCIFWARMALRMSGSTFSRGCTCGRDVIFDFQDFESGAGLNHVADLAFGHLEDDGFDLRREIAFFEGAEIAAVFCGAALGIKLSDVAEIVAVDDAGAQALDFAAHGGNSPASSFGAQRNFREHYALGQREFLLVRIVILLHFVGGDVHLRADFAADDFLLEQAVANGGFVIFPAEAGSFDALFQIVECGEAVLLANFVEALGQVWIRR